jgi:hypothetical protein
MAHWARVLAGVGILGLLAGAVSSQWDFAPAAGERDRSDRKVDFSPISGDPDKPRRHFRIKNPASLTPEEASAIGSELGAEMAAGYGRSGDPSALTYQSWDRYNTTPYRSATHGQRYVNNYANPAARDYRRFEDAGTLPVGAVIAKDSFTVTRDGVASPGALFMMEKMPEGFNYVSGDWRYTMILSDGSLFGTTNGENSERVGYCITCHLAREANDHLFFVPEAVRVKR